MSMLGYYQSLKQRWATERCFLNYGTLHRTISNLLHIVKSDSTLGSERSQLMLALNIIQEVKDDWSSPILRKQSKDQYFKYRNIK